MRSLVTGASGFIGRRLAAELARRGDEVACLVRRTSRTAPLRGLPVELVVGDVGDPASLLPAVAGRDRVFHLAGSSRRRARRLSRRPTSGAPGTSSKPACGPRRASAASSSSRASPRRAPAGRTGRSPRPTRPIPSPPTAAASWPRRGSCATRVPACRRRSSGRRTCSGPDRRSSTAAIGLLRRRLSPKIGDGRPRTSLVDVDDLVSALILAAEDPRSAGETYFVTDGGAYAWPEIVAALAVELGIGRFRIGIPFGAQLAAAGLAEAFSRATGRPPLLTREIVRAGHDRFWLYDGSKIGRDLGFRPRYGMRDSVRRAVEASPAAPRRSVPRRAGGMTGGRRLLIAGLEIRLADFVTLGALVVLTAVAIAFRGRLDRPAYAIGTSLAVIALYILSQAVLRVLRPPWLRFAVRTAAVQLTCLQIYQTAVALQLLLFPWQDARVLAWEAGVFPVNPVIAIQKVYTPALSEWMFFVYVFYVVIYPLLAFVIFFKHGEEANEDYLFHLGLVNLVCGLGFILFPVASPMYWPKIRDQLTAPQTARFFGSVAEWIRANVHTAGGSIPSPHCAVATVMWFMALKYTKRGFAGLAPVILSLYVSTVYGRFHYLSDMVIGIAAAGLVIVAAPAIERAWNRNTVRLPGESREPRVRSPAPTASSAPTSAAGSGNAAGRSTPWSGRPPISIFSKASTSG